jgi:SAM-dependent methyltransferase
MKSEVRSVVDTIDALGAAIAPGAGLEGAGPRLAELRERVYSLERRIRVMLTERPATPPPVGTANAQPLGAQPSSASATQTVASDLFDYVGFEQRFRGDQRTVLDALEERYLDLLKSSPPVLDIGCGRGELLGLLGEHGVEAYGVDTDASMVAEARADGLNVRREDAIAHLEQLEPGSLGAIISTHVVEHLELSDLLHLIELSTSRLRPGGIFVAETPNPASLIVLGNSYILDPTHVRPLHPSLMSFLCESAGFRGVQLQFFAPAEGYWLELVDAPDTPAWVEQVNNALRKLNDVLFGPQEYAIIARTRPDTTAT